MGATGKIEINPTVHVRNHDDLAAVYTPGVATEVKRVADDSADLFTTTNAGNSVLIVSDGSAVLGVGDVGPRAALPVLEGKAALFKTFAGVDAWPLCLNSRGVADIVRTLSDISSTIGGINLEDVAAPRCFDITRRLDTELDIPVFHDDQHGTAVIVLAALHNALRVVGKELADVVAVVSGAGAAGSAITRLLLEAGVGDVTVCDSSGVLNADSQDLDQEKRWLAQNTNAHGRAGALSDSLADADVFIGVSAPGILDVTSFEQMRDDPIVFGLANPEPEFDAGSADRYATVVATGRSDMANQINNALVFPGLFRGLLDGRLHTCGNDVHLAAAHAIADLVDQPDDKNIVPDIFDERLVPAVSAAVSNCAR